MKNKILAILQRIGKSFMLPIAILPIAGLLQGIAIAFTNESMIKAYHLEALLGQETLIYSLMLILKNVGAIIFDNLPLIFAAGVSLGMAKKEKGVAALSAVIAFFVMHITINSMLILDGQILADGSIANDVIQGTIVNLCGIQTLEMGTFGGIVVGLGVAFLHNRYYKVEFPEVFSFFGGTRFVPIISTMIFILVGMTMFYIWPIIQNGIYVLGHLVMRTGYVGTLIFGIIKRALVPFGLHHLFYLPFWQTAVGGSMVVNGTMIYGGQNIFFAQMVDPNLVHYSVEGTRYFTGEFIFMIFGLPGAALAMYQCANQKNKKSCGVLLLSAALTSMFTGITEPIEFSFIFAAPILYGVQVLLAGSAYMIAHILNITVGLTFSGGLIDFIMFGVLQGQSKTNWMMIIPVGIVYFLLYYIIFKYLILKYNLKTLGRDNYTEITTFKSAKNKSTKKENDTEYVPDIQSVYVVRGLGGRNNFKELDCCVTRLRATIVDNSKVDEGLLKQSGAAGVVCSGDVIQVIYGPRASIIKAKIEEYLEHESDSLVENKVINNNIYELVSIVNGVVSKLEESKDEMVAKKLLGDGLIIFPEDNKIKSPCKGKITMIFPTKHAIGITLENGIEILIHFGVNTVSLNGKGFKLYVENNQEIMPGDLLWEVDLDYIKANATSEEIMIILINAPKNLEFFKLYGYKEQGELIGYIKKEEC